MNMDQVSLGSSDVELVRQYGGPVSHAILNPPYQIFRREGIPGIIGYVLHGRCVVVMGDPVASVEYRSQLVDAFHQHCTVHNWRAIYVVTHKEMAFFADHYGGAMMQFANKLVTNPQKKLYLDQKGNRLKSKSNTARKSGVTVREYDGTSPDYGDGFEQKITDVIHQWQKARKGYQLFLEIPDFFNHRHGCRWFIAEHDGIVVGVLYLLKTGFCDCQYTIDLVLSSPFAPNFTNELMILTAMDQLGSEGVDAMSLAVGPSKTLGKIVGLGLISAFLAHGFYGLATRLVPQHGKVFFWDQFGVSRREPLYLYFQQPTIGPAEFRALLKTFNFSRA